MTKINKNIIIGISIAVILVFGGIIGRAILQEAKISLGQEEIRERVKKRGE